MPRIKKDPEEKNTPVCITVPPELLAAIDANRGSEGRTVYIRFLIRLGLFQAGAENEQTYNKGKQMVAASLEQYKAAADKLGIVVNRKPNKKQIEEKAPVLEVRCMCAGFFRLLKGKSADHKKVLDRLLKEGKCVSNF